MNNKFIIKKCILRLKIVDVFTIFSNYRKKKKLNNTEE